MSKPNPPRTGPKNGLNRPPKILLDYRAVNRIVHKADCKTQEQRSIWELRAGNLEKFHANLMALEAKFFPTPKQNADKAEAMAAAKADMPPDENEQRVEDLIRRLVAEMESKPWLK